HLPRRGGRATAAGAAVTAVQEKRLQSRWVRPTARRRSQTPATTKPSALPPPPPRPAVSNGSSSSTAATTTGRYRPAAGGGASDVLPRRVIFLRAHQLV
ncbi:unnamed protein product, partial [Ectocarpus sp. 12 AP-2014]